ncbi:MAG: hypothetical protein IPJ74_03465 [Saprospiraceae bacterium]|nr:hypothetical protein [Saprospiraceae bacterium]
MSGTAIDGSTRIYAEDIDEGSYDDCGPIALKTRRTFADTLCADAYVALVTEGSHDELSDLTFFTAFELETFYFNYPWEAYNQYYHEFVDGWFTVNGDGDPVRAIFTSEKKAGNSAGGYHLFSILGDYVDILCCDVQDKVVLELWVFDDANMNGVPGDFDYVWGRGDLDNWLWDYYGCYNEEVKSDYFYPCLPECGKMWDNHNICWLEVLVEDKVPPVCKLPQPEEIYCNDPRIQYLNNLNDVEDPCVEYADLLDELFGGSAEDLIEGGYVLDNCVVTGECVSVDDDRDECGVGYITRCLEFTDGQFTIECCQTLWVTEHHEYIIGFPADKEGECRDNILDTCIYINEIGCDLLAIKVKDEKFTATGDECYKIFRTFEVLNWCEYDGQSAPVVIGRDVDGDGVPGDEDVWLIRRPGNTYIDRAGTSSKNWTQDLCGNPTLPSETDGIPSTSRRFWDDKVRSGNALDINTNPIIDVTENNNWGRGYWQYTQLLKVYDDTAPIITVEDIDTCSYSSDIAKNCPVTIDIPFTVVDDCTPNDVFVKVFVDGVERTSKVTGTAPNFVIEDQVLGLGAHLIEVHAKDGCANGDIKTFKVTVLDCKAPAPICINGLSIELMPDGAGSGMNVVWASDFIASEIDDCSGIKGYAIYRSDDTTLADAGFIPDVEHSSIAVTCADFNPSNGGNPNGVGGTVLVRLYAIDEAGNFDFCETYVLVQDNMFNLCGVAGPGTIAGLITTEENGPVEGVTVQLSGQASQVNTTNLQGSYAFTNLQLGYDYSITPVKDNGYLNGVSTFDLVLISKHILGVQPIASPYKLIAADVNNSKNISILDLIALRKLILSVDTEFANNTSWRFVDASYSFPVPTNPWSQGLPGSEEHQRLGRCDQQCELRSSESG